MTRAGLTAARVSRLLPARPWLLPLPSPFGVLALSFLLVVVGLVLLARGTGGAVAGRMRVAVERRVEESAAERSAEDPRREERSVEGGGAAECRRMGQLAGRASLAKCIGESKRVKIGRGSGRQRQRQAEAATFACCRHLFIARPHACVKMGDAM